MQCSRIRIHFDPFINLCYNLILDRQYILPIRHDSHPHSAQRDLLMSQPLEFCLPFPSSCWVMKNLCVKLPLIQELQPNTEHNPIFLRKFLKITSIHPYCWVAWPIWHTMTLAQIAGHLWWQQCCISSSIESLDLIHFIM